MKKFAVAGALALGCLNAPAMASDEQNRFCMNDGSTSFCVQSTSPLTLTPYSAPRNDQPVINVSDIQKYLGRPADSNSESHR